MLKINDNLYVNKSNIVKAVQDNSEYYLILLILNALNIASNLHLMYLMEK